MRVVLLCFALFVFIGTSAFAGPGITFEEYVRGMFTFQGPLLSVFQASVGTYAGLMLTKHIANGLNVSIHQNIDQFPLIAWSVGSSVALVGMGIIGLHTGLPPYIYYPIPTAIALILPKFLFDLTWEEEGIYVVTGTLIGLSTHVLFSLFAGYNNYLPFWKIDPIWKTNNNDVSLYSATILNLRF